MIGSTTNWTSKTIYILLIVTILTSVISGDLPSCYRARCSHCNVPFIAKMCSSVCSSCDNFNVQNLQSDTKIQTGIPLKKAESFNQARLYGQSINVPYDGTQAVNVISNQRGPTYETYQANHLQNRTPYAHQLPEEQIPRQQQRSSNNDNNNYPGSMQNQQSALQSSSLSNQATGFGSSYTPYNNVQNIASNKQSAQQSKFQQSQYFQQFQPQQIQNSFNPFFNAQQQQPLGGTQPGIPQQNSIFANPFQPFLQQSYPAQQYPQAFTPAPPVITPFPAFTMPPFPTLPTITPPSPLAPQQYSYFQAQNPQSYSQQTFPSYSQSQVVSPAAVPPAPLINNQSRLPQTPTQEYQPDTPKQIYNQRSAIYPNNYNQIAPFKQPEAQIATNIDTSSIYVNKNAYEEKNKAYIIGTCPKQPNWEPCITKELANERFHNCCQRLGEGCSAICNYDLPLSTLQLTVLTGRCPLAKVADVMLCASGYEDASACCQAYGVFEAGYEHCRPYCNPAGGLPNDGMLAEKYRCLGKLTQIQRCFYASQKP